MNKDLIRDMARAYALPGLTRASGVAARLLPIPQPTLRVGPGSSARLGAAIAAFGHRTVLLVSDAAVAKLGLAPGRSGALAVGGTRFVVFDGATPDAPITLAGTGIAAYQHAGCGAIVAFGGGSVPDAARVIGPSAANTKHPRQRVGHFRARTGRPGPI